jgi:transposase-like protein
MEMTEVNPRQEKGKAIEEQGNQIRRIDEFTYSVRSQTRHVNYTVVKTNSSFVCNCPDHKFRKVCCKHIHSVEISIQLREQVRENNKTTISPINISSCQFCKSDNIKKSGIRKNKSGDIQRFACKDCSKTFSINLGFEKMKSSPETITQALQLYFTGESLRNVQKFLKLQGVDVSHKTIYFWITKYTKLMKAYLDKITPQVGDTWRADEVYVKIRGELKYVFSLMDDQTRFWIAQEVADRKNGHDASGLLRQGKLITQTKPKVFITDGLPSYAIASKKEFWARNRESRTTHIRHIHIQKDMNNNKMERLNGEFRDREKVARGLKKDDSPLIDGYQLYHNYIRPHMSLDGKTPSEACGITVNGENKWKTLIQNASQNIIK